MPISNHSTQALDPSPDLAQAAYQYALAGRRIIPLKPGTKVPRFIGYQGKEYGPWDAYEHWSRYPDDNIGIFVNNSGPNDPTVPDIDRHSGKPDGWQSIGNLIDQNTFCVQTPSGGFHFYYQSTSEHLSARDFPGVDVPRYCVAPPSRLYDEKGVFIGSYQQINGSELAPLPEPLRAALTAPEPSVDDTDMPHLLKEAPQLPVFDLKDKHRAFLATGVVKGFPSRSEVIHSLATKLYQLGHTDSEVLTMLWAEDWIQTTALQKRQQNYDKALEYLWDSCRKVRHHRRLTAQEAFSPQAQERFRQIELQAHQATDLDAVRNVLWETASAGLSATEEDQIFGILRQHGYTKQTLARDLKTYKQQQLVRSEDAIQWVQTEGVDNRPVAIYENVDALLKAQGIIARYNTMAHKAEYIIPGQQFARENERNDQYTYIENEVWKAGMRPQGRLDSMLKLLAHQNLYHPFPAQLAGGQWDGVPRLRSLLDCLQVEDCYRGHRDLLVTRWLLSVVAMVYGYGDRRPRGVLVLQGAQFIGKTSFFDKIALPETHNAEFTLDTTDKDSMLEGMRTLTTEIAELDFLNTKHPAKLKAFLTRAQDNIRKAYAREASEMERKTVFCGSVNPTTFLTDPTGNSRFWVVPVCDIDLDAVDCLVAGTGRVQLWLELYARYAAGEPWTLTREEMRVAEVVNEKHREVTYPEQRVLDLFDWDSSDRSNLLRASDIVDKVFRGRAPTQKEQAEMTRAVIARAGKARDTTRTVGGKRQTGKFYEMPPFSN